MTQGIPICCSLSMFTNTRSITTTQDKKKVKYVFVLVGDLVLFTMFIGRQLGQPAFTKHIPFIPKVRFWEIWPTCPDRPIE